MNKKPPKIVIIDDEFPQMAIGFRLEEYNWYIENIGAHIFCSPWILQSYLAAPYKAYYEKNMSHIHSFYEIRAYPDIDLIYIVFLHKIFAFYSYLIRFDKPFICAIYNTQFLYLNSPKTDNELAYVLRHPMCRGVIVAQKMWYDYIIKKGFCDPKKIKLIYGGLSNVPISSLPKKKYPQDKDTFDLCFTAHNYGTSFIYSKGYDSFIEIAKILAKQDAQIRFHVIGGFNASSVDISGLEKVIKFYGTLDMSASAPLYRQMDIMISLTRATKYSVGGHTEITADGFPTISCVDAVKNGVFLITTDSMGNNIYFKNKKHLYIVENDDNESIAKQILEYKNNSTRFYEVAEQGQLAFQKIFNTERQMSKRVQFFNEVLDY